MSALPFRLILSPCSSVPVPHRRPPASPSLASPLRPAVEGPPSAAAAPAPSAAASPAPSCDRRHRAFAATAPRRAGRAKVREQVSRHATSGRQPLGE